MPARLANTEQEPPGFAMRNVLQLLTIPLWVGPGAMMDVVVLEDLLDVGEPLVWDTPTQ
jgi:hypothetical protein